MSARKLPAGVLPAIGRLREIVAQSGDATLLGEGPFNPDHRLLDLCADALHLLVHAERAYASYRNWDEPQTSLFRDYEDGTKAAKPKLSAISKIRATTAAGIFAKAMVVRASKTGAPVLAMSLAEDLVNCPGLRALLWPAEIA